LHGEVSLPGSGGESVGHKVVTAGEAYGGRNLNLSIRAASEVIRPLICGLAFVLVSPLGVARQSGANSGAWSGILVSSACNADEAFNESPECMKDVPGAQIALYDDTNRVMYGLEPQEKVTAHLGDTVTVRGTLDGDAIRIASVELMSIGIAVGQKAPDFSMPDQSGRVQTLDTLKGANGTVLLFFRSADW
jgi:hypothetical protein